MADHKSHHSEHHVSISEKEEILNLHPEDGESHADNNDRPHHHDEEDDVPADAPICAACQKNRSSYETFPCRCNKFCKKCAMKMATGGKCKTCHNLFASMTHLTKSSHQDEE